MMQRSSNSDLEALFVPSKDNKKKSKKIRRQSFGDAADPESYKGPWAAYEESGEVERSEELDVSDQSNAIHESKAADQSNAIQESTETDQSDLSLSRKSSTSLIDLPLHKVFSPSGEHSILHQEYSIQCNPPPLPLSTPTSPPLPLPISTLPPIPTSHSIPLLIPTSSPLPSNTSTSKRTLKLNHHTRSIYSIKLFPITMHLMLSCGADNTIKLWSSTFPAYNCLRTFIGHRSAVRDVDFNASGSHFASCSFDKSIKLWNTQSGLCIGKISLHSLPFIVHFLPDNSVLVALGEGSMEKYSVQSLLEGDSEATGSFPSSTTNPLPAPMCFEGHLAPINSITLLPEGKCFTTSEDKTARIWSLTEGTQLFYYAVPPSMSPLTAVTLHSASSTLACQSFKGKIFCFSLQLKPVSITLNAKKQFYGFKSRGYICPLTVCCGTTALASGDAEGNVFIWDWEKGFVKGKGERALRHERAVSALVWNAGDGCLISGGLDGVLCVQKVT